MTSPIAREAHLHRVKAAPGLHSEQRHCVPQRQQVVGREYVGRVRCALGQGVQLQSATLLLCPGIVGVSEVNDVRYPPGANHIVVDQQVATLRGLK